jgi:hypothetical protein
MLKDKDTEFTSIVPMYIRAFYRLWHERQQKLFSFSEPKPEQATSSSSSVSSAVQSIRLCSRSKKMDFDTVSGEHAETALLCIHTEKEDTEVPAVVPYHSGQSFFVYHPNSCHHLRNLLMDFLINWYEVI